MLSMHETGRRLMLTITSASCVALLSACASSQRPCQSCQCPEPPQVPEVLLKTEVADLKKFRSEVLRYVQNLQSYSNELKQLQAEARVVQLPSQPSSPAPQPGQDGVTMPQGKTPDGGGSWVCFSMD